MLEHYELIFIVPGSVEEANVIIIKEKILSLLKKADAEITKEESWERKKLAYKIGQETHGCYQIIEFDVEGQKIKDLSHQLQLTPEVLRYLITKAVVKTAEEIAEEVQIKAKIRARQAESVKKELKEAEEIAEQEKKVEIKKEEEITEGKLSMADLDKKLNEILNDDLKV